MSDSTAGPERPAPVLGDHPHLPTPVPGPPAPGSPAPHPEPAGVPEPAPLRTPSPGAADAQGAAGTAGEQRTGETSGERLAGAAAEDDSAARTADGQQAAQEYDPAAPAPLGVERTPTGHAEVDARLQRLADADHLATDGHVEVYEDVHRGLRDTLTALDTRPGPPAPASGHGGSNTRS